MPKTTPSLTELGLKKHLETTRQDHNGLGYNDFLQQLEVMRHPSGNINKAAIGRLFGVDKRTAGRWIKLHDKEKRNAAA